MGSNRSYIAIDLKSFYASAECRERGLDPLTTNLVVADVSRTEKTICLAVSPSLKAYGISGRARLFEVVSGVREANLKRNASLRKAPLNDERASIPFHDATADKKFANDCLGSSLEAYHPISNSLFTTSSFDDSAVKANPYVELDYLIAKPRMSLYIKDSIEIYEVYLKYFAPEDIHVYSIDEVFVDVTNYLRAYKMDAKRLASNVVKDIYETTGITATAGVGTNMYLAKVAMDILAKHEQPDEFGVRIAELNEESYKRRLWDHKPITDFWRVGRGIANRLETIGIRTMGDIALCSVADASSYRNEDLLFKMLGKNAELLIDHAWGYEPVSMSDVKAYKPKARSTVAGQVLMRPYTFDEARLVVWEMSDQLALDLTSQGLVVQKLVLTISYDRESLNDSDLDAFHGEVVEDRYARRVPKPAHGTTHLDEPSSSSHAITQAVLALYDRIVDEHLLVRKVSISADDLLDEQEAVQAKRNEQLDLFYDEEEHDLVQQEREREKKLQNAMVGIREKFGKNAILKAPSLQEAATARQRNSQIGGHSA